MNRQTLTSVCGLMTIALLTLATLDQYATAKGGSGGGRGVGGAGKSSGVKAGPAASGVKSSPVKSSPVKSATKAAGAKLPVATGRTAATSRTGAKKVAGLKKNIRFTRRNGGSGAPADGGDGIGGGDENGETAVAQGGELYGVKITQMFQGTAARQGLRVGDIILSLNDIETPTFDALASAVQQSGSRAEVVFVNVENGERELIVLYPAGALGVSGEAVRVQ